MASGFTYCVHPPQNRSYPKGGKPATKPAPKTPKK